MVSQPGSQILSGLGLVQRQHGALVTHTGKLFYSRISDVDCRRTRHHKAGLLLQGAQLIVEGIVFQVGHDLRITGIVSL